MRTFIFSAFLILLSSFAFSQQYLEIRHKNGTIVDRALKPNFKDSIHLKSFEMSNKKLLDNSHSIILNYDVDVTSKDMKDHRRTFVIYYSEFHPFLGTARLFKQGLIVSHMEVPIDEDGWYIYAAVNNLGSEITIFEKRDGKLFKHKSILGKTEDVMLFYNLEKL